MLTNEQVLSIAENLLRLDDFILQTLQCTEGLEWLANFEDKLWEDDLKLIAIMVYTGDLYEDVDTDEYLVCTVEERQDRLIEYAENYYDDIVVKELPSYLIDYVDNEGWVKDHADNLEYDAGEILSSNGVEEDVTVLNTDFYIYSI